MPTRDLKQLLADAQRAEVDALLSLREVATLTGTALSTISRWVHVDRVLPHEHAGPTRRVRVRLSVVLQFFPHPESAPINTSPYQSDT
jgi:predicted DNA-binding transcriptional regulator AlpA